jgi:hypothetical protein
MDVAEMLKEITPQIRETVVIESQKHVANCINWALSEQIKEMTSAFIKTDVLPEVQMRLADKREELIAAIVAQVEIGVHGLAEKVGETMAKNLANGWKVEKAIKELMNSY